MNFEEFKEELKSLNVDSKKSVEMFVENINVNESNFEYWIDNIFSDKINELELNKLPYVIDCLFTTNDKLKFMLCCMLIESTCESLPFITNLENYPVYRAKYKVLKNTLVTVYERVDNGIANCMELIMLNNDPKFEMFSEEEKYRLIQATKRKLNDILTYLEKNEDVNEAVYNVLELIIDLATYLNDYDIESLINRISNYKMNFSCKLFIMKYKIINNLEIESGKIEELLKSKKELERVVNLFEKNNMLDKLPLNNITQEEIAKSNMIKWLEYPTELGKIPDEIELIGKFEFNNHMYYAYKFKSNDFIVKDFMLGIAGGYEKDKITSITTGCTFSKFEVLKDNYIQQAIELVEFIYSYWSNKKKY